MQGPKSAEAVEKEQEAKLKAKYGNLGAKKKLMPKVCCLLAVREMQRCFWRSSAKTCHFNTPQTELQDHKFFDSADWALSKQGVKTENKQDTTGLEPKLEPTAMRPRRTSHLGEDEP